MTLRHQALFSVVTFPARPRSRPLASPQIPGAAARWLRVRGRRLVTRAALGLALVLLVVAGALLLLRSAHADRVYPAVYVADQPLGGLSHVEARAALERKAQDLESGTIAFAFDGREWRPTLRELGVTIDVERSLDEAYAVGREDEAWDRLRATADLLRQDERIPLAMSLDHAVLGRWFDRVDRELGLPPRDAALAIENGTSVAIVPEADGTVVDRQLATARVLASLRGLRPLAEPLPVVAKPAVVRAGDLAEARERLAQALGRPVQVTLGPSAWTLLPADLGRFVTQRVDPTKRGAEAFSLGLDRAGLATWLGERLAPEINREPRDAVVGWNGRLVSVEESIDGTTLRPEELAGQVETSFFGDHVPVPAPVTITKPTIDSANLDALGVTTLLGTGTSNYSGSSDGRATNVDVGAYRLNGTLVPPRGEFSFNHSIGVINEANGFVEAQVIEGERIGQDIGGGICQVSTTVFRAAFLAGLPIGGVDYEDGEWWPHRYQLSFYEYDGWPPGLDASILQPTEDPSTWGDFTFLNPSDSWLLVEAWTAYPNVVVNIYGPDLGYQVERQGPHFGNTYAIEPDLETVNPELEPGSVVLTELPQEGLEVGHFRQVFDRNGNLVREANFYTRYYSRGNVWQVSPDMKGKSPADPDRPIPPPKPPPGQEAPADETNEV